MKPHIICHMMTSLDGRLHPSRWTKSPDGTCADWSVLYAEVQDALDADAWIVGRVTMAEMTKAGPHAPTTAVEAERPHHFPVLDAKCYAVALDRSGKLHFNDSQVEGAHVVVVLGSDVNDRHLAELAGDGISYIVAPDPEMSLLPILEVLRRDLGIERLLLEGGASINGAFFAAGVVDEFSLLVAPALDGRSNSQSIVEFGEVGLSDKVQLKLKSSEILAHGAMHLRYAVSAD